MKINTLPDQVHFVFVDDIINGKFFEKTKAGLTLPRLDLHQVHGRWGKVINKGSDVKADYNVDDFIFIDSFRWTQGSRVSEDSRVWRADPTGILAYVKKDNADLSKMKFFGK